MGKIFKSYNYCGVFLGNIEGVDEFIGRVSIGEKIGTAKSSNVSIITFISIFTVEELTDFFKAMLKEEGLVDNDNTPNHNFFIMRVEDASIYFNNTSIYERLFEVFKEDEDIAIELIDVDTMGEDEKDGLINKILDKGSDLSDYDQKLLELLTRGN